MIAQREIPQWQPRKAAIARDASRRRVRRTRLRGYTMLGRIAATRVLRAITEQQLVLWIVVCPKMNRRYPSAWCVWPLSCSRCFSCA